MKSQFVYQIYRSVSENLQITLAILTVFKYKNEMFSFLITQTVSYLEQPLTFTHTDDRSISLETKLTLKSDHQFPI